jgi:hypothetical protein
MISEGEERAPASASVGERMSSCESSVRASSAPERKTQRQREADGVWQQHFVLIFTHYIDIISEQYVGSERLGPGRAKRP